MLYAETKKAVTEFLNGQTKLTLGYDGFKPEYGGHVINFTEATDMRIAFHRCPGPETRHKDNVFLSDAILAELKSSAKVGK